MNLFNNKWVQLILVVLVIFALLRLLGFGFHAEMSGNKVGVWAEK